MTENAEPPVEPPASPGPRRPPAAAPPPAGRERGRERGRGRNQGRGRRVARGAAASALAGLAVLVSTAPPALASPAVQPVSTFGQVPQMGLNMVNGAALHCPAGVTAWSPMIVPIEMAIPHGDPNGSLDPRDVKNMPNDTALWYRTLGSTTSGGPMVLDKAWTQDGRSDIPIVRTGLRSGTYLLGALCAKPSQGRHVYPLDANGAPIGEWYVVTFTWVDRQPTQGTFRFERQYTEAGSEAGSAGSAAAPPTAAASGARTHHHGSGGLGWPGWLGIGAALAAALAVG
ncbi:hypothetical protein EBO15_25565, partial [Actinomadura harenae]